MVCSIPTLIIGLVLSSNKAKAYILSVCNPSIQSFLTSGAFQLCVIIFFALLSTIVVYLIERYNNKTREDGIDLLADILANISVVVDQKRTRFKETLEKQTGRNKLKSIANPSSQIKWLCISLCSVMRTFTGDKNLKSSIVLCSNGDITDYLAICGEDAPKVNISELNENSIAKSALTSQTPIIIEDTKENKSLHDKYFYKPKACTIQSMCSFPVLVGDKVALIISFTSARPKTLRTDFIEVYKIIIKEFSDRILLEKYLLDLISKKNNEK
jgi:transcriptional regulator with GAF, ATPase, and Fis domain